jgi:hypothetical protein
VFKQADGFSYQLPVYKSRQMLLVAFKASMPSNMISETKSILLTLRQQQAYPYWIYSEAIQLVAAGFGKAGWM